jgi:hypothetical protein
MHAFRNWSALGKLIEVVRYCREKRMANSGSVTPNGKDTNALNLGHDGHKY